MKRNLGSAAAVAATALLLATSVTRAQEVATVADAIPREQTAATDQACRASADPARRLQALRVAYLRLYRLKLEQATRTRDVRPLQAPDGALKRDTKAEAPREQPTLEEIGKRIDGLDTRFDLMQSEIDEIVDMIGEIVVELMDDQDASSGSGAFIRP